MIKSLKIIREYRRDPILFFKKQFQENGHRSVLNILGKKLIIVSHPEDVVHVLKENNQSYSKGRTFKAIKDFLGNGLITSEGEAWRKQHRLIRPVMNPKSVYEFAPKIDKTVREFLETIPKGVPVDSFHEMNRLAWRIILKTLFSQEATKEMDSWLDDVLFLMESITHRTRSAIKIPYVVPTAGHRRVRAIVAKFENYIYRLIEERKNSPRQNDLLQLLLEIQDDENSSAHLSKQSIKDEILTFLMAGHETITNTLSWTMILLAQNPQYREKLAIEASEFFKTTDYVQLNTSPWHGAVIDESMRVWPPVWAFMRLAEKDDAWGDFKVPKGSNIILSPFLSHRAPDMWEKAEQFYPERFLEKKKLPQGQFYPYGLGPRACIGAYFAGMEAKIILANLIQNFSWKIQSPAEQTYEAGITLRPTNNTVMIFGEP